MPKVEPGLQPPTTAPVPDQLSSESQERGSEAGHETIRKQYSTEGQVGLTLLVQDSSGTFVRRQLRVEDNDVRDVECLQPFKDECEFLRILKHPAFPEVIDAYAQNNTFTLVLTSVEGPTLFEHVYPTGNIASPQKPRLPDIVRWSRQLAQALAYLHMQVPFPRHHLELTPHRLVISPQNDLRLLDFGRLCSYEVIAGRIGQPAYPPNPFSAGFFLDTDSWGPIQNDLFGFGRIIDFLLTGQVPTKVGQPHAAEEQDFLEAYRSLARAVARCCSARSADHYDSFNDVIDELALIDVSQITADDEMEECPECHARNRRSIRFCTMCGSLLHKSHGGEKVNDASIVYDQAAHSGILDSYERNHYSELRQFLLREALDEAQTDPGFDRLMVLDSLAQLQKLPHQREAAMRALQVMRGRVLLADEVGLGKTIEAGIILKELLERKLVQNVLIVCPTQLAGQWQLELYEKFDEVFLVMGKDIDTGLALYCPRLIIPYGVLEQRFHAEESFQNEYGLIILDEAHFLNEPSSERILHVIQNLRKKYFLLLSATPMHNELKELYNIVTLLRPGHFSDWPAFEERFVDQASENGVRHEHVAELRDFLSEVMIRNTRREVQKHTKFPKRRAERFPVALSPRARDFFERFQQFYQDQLTSVTHQGFTAETSELVERLCSSAAAFRQMVNRLQHKYPRGRLNSYVNTLSQFAADYPRELTQPKIEKAFEIARLHVDQEQKVLIFSQFNKSIVDVYQQAQARNESNCFLYDEEADPAQKVAVLREFRQMRSGCILFCPGEISEGVNLQHASVMINLDLPWDPMKIEQRIGRIQRIGGFDEVYIANLYLADTIEEKIIDILEHKIRMFEAVVGPVEEIVGNLREGTDLRALIRNMFLNRDEEDENGEKQTAEEIMHREVDDAVKRSSQAESSALNSIFLAYGDDETDGGWN